jgi:hypothetical protein
MEGKKYMKCGNGDNGGGGGGKMEGIGGVGFKRGKGRFYYQKKVV